MHCLVEIKDDEYEILSVSECPEELTRGQSSEPLRIVLSAETMALSLSGKREKQNLREALQNRAALH